MDARRGPPRALLVWLGGLALAMLAGGGTVWAHYRSTPTFREWLRATPVDDAVWRAHVPAGEELGRGAAWRSDDGPPRERFGQWRARATFEHGDEVLLDLEVEVRVESREVEGWREEGGPSEAYEGLDVFLTERGRDADVHGVAVLTLRDVGWQQGPRMQLDVFALAGPGSVELVVQQVPGDGGAGTGPLLGGSEFTAPSGWLTGAVMAQFLSLEDPPPEGVAYQGRARVYPTWTQVEGGASGPARGRIELAATTRLYSAKLQWFQAFRAPYDPTDHFGISTTCSASSNYTWNGEVW